MTTDQSLAISRPPNRKLELILTDFVPSWTFARTSDVPLNGPEKSRFVAVAPDRYYVFVSLQDTARQIERRERRREELIHSLLERWYSSARL